RCLDAITVALNQSWDAKRWYTSTMELQLASLDFCVACRSVPTLHLIVDDDTPSRLLRFADGEEHASVARDTPDGGRCKSRVPRFLARSVTWGVASAERLKSPIGALSKVESFVFGNAFNDRVEGVSWPPRVERLLVFGEFFNQPIEKVEWPASLELLVFGWEFNQRISQVVWPPSLRRLVFGVRF
ncbi:unnamed protein product, partial [Hapterophycus canaliculatus]